MSKFKVKKSDIESGDNLKDAEISIARFCAYQERTILQVRDKLKLMGISLEDSEQIVLKMNSEGFINEQRYANAFTLGKLNQNKWGRLKISYTLRQKGITEEMIGKAFSDYGEDKYLELIKKLARRKFQELKGIPDIARKNRIARFLTSKGFENELIWDTLKREFSRKK
jgi:regulatory protein